MMPSSSLSPDRVRLLDLARERSASLSSLSHLIGRNPAYLQQFVRRGTPRKLEEDDRRKLAHFFGVKEAELGGVEEKSYPANVGDSLIEWLEVPRYDIDASAGPGAMSDNAEEFDAFCFSRRWLAQQGLKGADLSAITVKGDSMEPLLRDGDDILVDKGAQPLRDGIHVVRFDDTLMVKRVARSGPGRVTLLSENPAYPPLEVPADAIAIIGRVVWKGGRI